MKNREVNESNVGKSKAEQPELRLSESEYRLMDVIWDEEPIGSTELSRLCLEKLGWKKSTSYTMLKRLADKKAIQNHEAVVTSLIDKDKVIRQESDALLKKSFGGSVPDFFAAFLQDRKLTREEAEKIAEMIRKAVE